MHLSTLVTFFSASSDFFVPYIILCTARLSLFHNETLFLPLNYIVYKCYSCFRQRRVIFFIITLVYSGYIAFPYVMHLYILVTLFFQNHQKIFVPRSGQFFHCHTCIQWLHSFSLYNAFVYTCPTSLLLHQNFFVPYIILCTARLSLFHNETLFLPSNYIVYKCYSCFRQRRGHFFSSSHLYTVVI